jgi:hypothetical protein
MSPRHNLGAAVANPAHRSEMGRIFRNQLAISPAGDVWVMDNWQDINSCYGNPPEGLSTRCGGPGGHDFPRHRETCSRTADRPRPRILMWPQIARVLVRLDHVAGPGKLLAARGAGASCGGFGFARNTTTFDIFNWL